MDSSLLLTTSRSMVSVAVVLTTHTRLSENAHRAGRPEKSHEGDQESQYRYRLSEKSRDYFVRRVREYLPPGSDLIQYIDYYEKVRVSYLDAITFIRSMLPS